VLVFWQAWPRIQVILKDGLTAVAGRRIHDVVEGTGILDWQFVCPNDKT
jgi:hypothetical protein